MSYIVTMDELIAAEGYFADRQQGGVWRALEQNTRCCALKSANSDIAMLLEIDSVDMTCDPIPAAAVYEQAIFLATRPALPAAPPGSELATESVDGIGSRSYRAASDAESRDYAPRALRLLAPYRRLGGVMVKRG